MPRDRAAFGEFLRARRDRLTPAQAGIDAFPGPRRVPGLRREELAVLAGLSPDYYSRLEQGRQARVSAEVLDALARALRLDDVERAHLHVLAAPTTRPHAALSREARQRPDPGLLRLIETLDHVPVLLLGRRGDILARNALLVAVLGRPLHPGTSFLRYLFCDPLARDRIRNWSDYASAAVASLRGELGRHPHDRQLAALVQELRNGDGKSPAGGTTTESATTPPSPNRSTTPSPATCPSSWRSLLRLTNPTNASLSTPPSPTRSRPATFRCSEAGPAIKTQPRSGQDQDQLLTRNRSASAVLAMSRCCGLHAEAAGTR